MRGMISKMSLPTTHGGDGCDRNGEERRLLERVIVRVALVVAMVVVVVIVSVSSIMHLQSCRQLLALSETAMTRSFESLVFFQTANNWYSSRRMASEEIANSNEKPFIIEPLTNEEHRIKLTSDRTSKRRKLKSGKKKKSKDSNSKKRKKKKSISKRSKSESLSSSSSSSSSDDSSSSKQIDLLKQNINLDDNEPIRHKPPQDKEVQAQDVVSSPFSNENNAANPPTSLPTSLPSAFPTVFPTTLPTTTNIPTKQEPSTPHSLPPTSYLDFETFHLTKYSDVTEDMPQILCPNIGGNQSASSFMSSTVHSGHLAVSNFPNDGTENYQQAVWHADQGISVESNNCTLTIEGTDEAEMRHTLDFLTLSPPHHSGNDFFLEVRLFDTNGMERKRCTHKVELLPPLADGPRVIQAESLFVSAKGGSVYPMHIALAGVRVDSSQVLSARIQIPRDSLGLLIGELEMVNFVQGVSFLVRSNGRYQIVASGNRPESRITLLNKFLNDGLIFRPRRGLNETMTGNRGILVEAVSTKEGEVAANNNAQAGTVGHFPRIAVGSTYMNVIVLS